MSNVCKKGFSHLTSSLFKDFHFMCALNEWEVLYIETPSPRLSEDGIFDMI